MSPPDLGHPTDDPRARLRPAPAGAPADDAGPAEYAAFDPEPGVPPQVVRAQHFLVEHAVLEAGAALRRDGQADEYMVLVPDPGAVVVARTSDHEAEVTRPSVVVMPPGTSALIARTRARVIRLLTVTSAPDLAATAVNRHSYRSSKANVAPYRAWPGPRTGHAVRVYDLDVPDEPGRFGRIWRCSTLMVNVLPVQHGPRDPRTLSPHTHPDFEQCSLALDGEFVHHLRWPWARDRTAWRDDLHLPAPAPSAVVVPPPAVHTTEATGDGPNRLVDVFGPPRADFSSQAGWVLNQAEYPLPESAD